MTTPRGDEGFVHLHVHSQHSALDSTARENEIVAAVKADGQTAVAFTNHGSLSGAWSEHEAARSAGIKPILGIEAYLAIGDRFDRDTIEVDRDPDAESGAVGKKAKRYHHVTVLVRNEVGWRNLVAMHNASWDSQFPAGTPQIDYALLTEHSEGLMVTTGCLGGPVLGPLSQMRRHGLRTRVLHARDLLLALEDEGEPALTALKQVSSACKTEQWGSQAETAERAAAAAALRAEMEALAAGAEDRAPSEAEELGGSDAPQSDLESSGSYAEVCDALTEVLAIVAAADGVDVEREQDARRGLDSLIAAVGRDNLYVEVMDHGIEHEEAAIPALVALAQEYDLPLVATNDCHYVHADGADAHEAWLGKQRGASLSDPKRWRFSGEGFHVRTAQEMYELRPEEWWQQACRNTVEVAARVEDEVLPKSYLRLPAYPLPEGYETSKDYALHLIREWLAQTYGTEVPAEVKERLNFESKVITGFKVWDYFLILWDLISWVRAQGWLVGFGRGSAPGSLVAFALGITRIDPLRHKLLFERFLDVTRIGMPDIDSDFPEEHLAAVQAYLVAKYGREFVARLGTFGVSRSKASIKSAASFLELKAADADRLSKAVPLIQGKAMTFSELDSQSSGQASSFWSAAAETPRSTEVIALARQFEGVVSSRGAHACGVVVSDAPLTDLVPMRPDTTKGLDPETAPRVLEWDHYGAEDGAGLLKLDALGLRTLDTVAATLSNITRLTGEVIDIYDLPDPDDLADPRVKAAWDLLAAGRTAGVFQLEGGGLTDYTRTVAPTSWEHLSALVALYRPGPMGADAHTIYARRKNGTEKVDYGIFTRDAREQEIIATVLDATMGVTVFQEQMMLLGDVVAGFGAAERNRLRKAVSKKNEAELAAVGRLFLAGARSGHPIAEVDRATGEVTFDLETDKHAFAESTADALWDTIKAAGAYAFNKSHSAAYGYLTYVTAFLKANWTAAFYAGVLSRTDKDEKRVPMMRDMRADGIALSPPDVNRSLASTSALDEQTVALGLGEIKNVGEKAALIVQEREANGPYASLADLFERTSGSGVSVVAIRSLIQAGALDALGPRRGLVQVAHAFGNSEDLAVPDCEWGVVDRAARQQQLMGTFTGQHPLTILREDIRDWMPEIYVEGLDEKVGMRPRPLARLLDGTGGANLTVCFVTGWEEKPARRGGVMAYAKLAGSNAEVEAVVWPDTVAALKREGIRVSPGSVVGILANVRTRTFETTDEEGIVTTSTIQSLSVNRVWDLPYTDPGVRETPLPPVLDISSRLFRPGISPTHTDPPKGKSRSTQDAPAGGEEIPDNVVPLRRPLASGVPAVVPAAHVPETSGSRRARPKDPIPVSLAPVVADGEVVDAPVQIAFGSPAALWRTNVERKDEFDLSGSHAWSRIAAEIAKREGVNVVAARVVSRNGARHLPLIFHGAEATLTEEDRGLIAVAGELDYLDDSDGRWTHVDSSILQRYTRSLVISLRAAS